MDETQGSFSEGARSTNFLPQQHSFVMFYIACLQTDDSEPIQKAVAKLILAHDRLKPEIAISEYFSDLLIDTRNIIIQTNGSKIREQMSAVHEYIVVNQVESPTEETQEDIDEVMEAIRKQIENLQCKW